MMYTVAKVTHEGPYTNKHGIWASDRTLFAVCELHGEAQIVADALNETDKRVSEARAEVERLRAERLAVAERAAKEMQEEFRQRAAQHGKAWLYEAVQQGWIDPAEVARRVLDADGGNPESRTG